MSQRSLFRYGFYLVLLRTSATLALVAADDVSLNAGSITQSYFNFGLIAKVVTVRVAFIALVAVAVITVTAVVSVLAITVAVVRVAVLLIWFLLLLLLLSPLLLLFL